MIFEPLFEEAEQRRKSLVVYAAAETDLDEQFAARNLRVEHRQLPPDDPSQFVVVRDDAGFRGAIEYDTLQSFLSPPVERPGSLDSLPSTHRAMYELLDDTVFAGLSPRQLLAATRELEDRAWRVGSGMLHVGFQSAADFGDQEPVYLWLAEETDFDIHVHVDLDDSTAADWPLTLHTDPDVQLQQYWFLAFDGGGDPAQKFALVARDPEPNRFDGFWTYDPDLVDRVFASMV